MDPYVVTFHLGLGIGVIGPAFYISRVIWDGTLFTSLDFYFIEKSVITWGIPYGL